MWSKLGYLHTTPDCFGLLFTHKNGDFCKGVRLQSSVDPYRVHTDFGIQNSRLFHTFSFSRLEVIKIGDQKRPKQCINKAFFMMRCKHTGETEYNLTKEKKKHIATAGCSFEKKRKTLPFLQTWSLFSRLFPGLEISGQINFKTFSRIQDSIQTLSLEWKVTYQIGVHTILNSFLCQHTKQSVIVLI